MPQRMADSAATPCHSAAGAQFPWPFLLNPPTPLDASPSAPASTPNFDAILAHIAGSALSPIVDGRFPAATVASAGSTKHGSSMSRLIGSMGPMSRSRYESLSQSLAEFERAQARYFASATLHQITGEIVEQLNAAHPPPTAATSTASYASAAGDNHSSLVADLNCLWHLAQAEPFLLMEPDAASTTAATGGSAAQDPDPSLFGLQWESLSGAFKPQSSAIPLAPSSSSHHSSDSTALQATTASRSHTFTNPARSALGSGLSSLLMPEIESALSERVDQAWNDFDPQATEREAEEQAALRAERGDDEEDNDLRAAAGEGEYSVPNRTQVPAAPLPKLDSASLTSVLSHRLARLGRLEDRVAALRRQIALQQSLHARTVASTLSTTWTLLADQTLRTESAVHQASLAYLQGKMSVCAEKMRKLEAEVQRDTYLGLHKDGAEHIIPSLRVIVQSLSALRSARQDELREKTRSLQRYQSMGSSFVELAEQLSTIQKQIENKKWTLQRMQ